MVHLIKEYVCKDCGKGILRVASKANRFKVCYECSLSWRSKRKPLDYSKLK